MPKGNFGSAIVACGVALALPLLSVGAETALAQGVNNCDRNQESFGFEIPDYPIEHQVQALLNIHVDYRFITTRPLQKADYINYVPVAEEIDKYLKRYPNETDFWEILNKNLVDFVLDKYPSIGSLRIRVEVRPNVAAKYARHSTVLKTRSNNCPLINEE